MTSSDRDILLRIDGRLIRIEGRLDNIEARLARAETLQKEQRNELIIQRTKVDMLLWSVAIGLIIITAVVTFIGVFAPYLRRREYYYYPRTESSGLTASEAIPLINQVVNDKLAGLSKQS